MPAALGFFAGISVGLIVSLVLCVWWVKTIHRSVFDDPQFMGGAGEGDDADLGDTPVAEEESEEWWKRS